MADDPPTPETRGVTTQLLGTVDLGPELAGLDGRQLRLRRVTIEPGGVFGPLHDHVGRPGVVYVLEGTITDHRDGAATEYGPGPGWPEDRQTRHWLENRGSVPAVEVSVDIVGEGTAPSLEANRAVVRRFIDEVFVAGHHEAVDELLTEDFVAHTWGPDPSGRDALKAAIDRVAQGLADATMTVEDEVAEGDRVVVRLTSEATQVGPFMGVAPTGKRYRIGEIHVFRLRDGRICEHWHQADFLGMLRQLGAMPGA